MASSPLAAASSVLARLLWMMASVGGQGQRAAVGGFGPFEIAGFLQRHTEIDPGLGEIAVETAGFGKGLRCLGMIGGFHQREAEGLVRGGERAVKGHRHARDADGFVDASGAAQEARTLDQRVGLAGMAQQQRIERGECVVKAVHVA